MQHSQSKKDLKSRRIKEDYHGSIHTHRSGKQRSQPRAQRQERRQKMTTSMTSSGQKPSLTCSFRSLTLHRLESGETQGNSSILTHTALTQTSPTVREQNLRQAKPASRSLRSESQITSQKRCIAGLPSNSRLRNRTKQSNLRRVKNAKHRCSIKADCRKALRWCCLRPQRRRRNDHQRS